LGVNLMDREMGSEIRQAVQQMNRRIGTIVFKGKGKSM